MDSAAIRERLVWKALCALDQVVEECAAGPAAPTLLLRFSLAFLYSVSSGGRESFDDFWRVVLDHHPSAYSRQQANYMRRTYAETHLAGIARTVGIERTAEICAAMKASYRRPAGAAHGGPVDVSTRPHGGSEDAGTRA